MRARYRLYQGGWTAIIPALASIAGGLISRSGSRSAAQQTGQYNAEEAQKDRDFQQSIFNQEVALDNNAVQRRVEDLKAAGLNPMLGYGGAAGVPSGMGGAQASMTVPNTQGDFGAGVASAGAAWQQAKLQQETIKNMQQDRAKAAAETQQAAAQARKNDADTILSGAQTSKVNSDTALNSIVGSKAMAETDLAQASAGQAHAQTDYLKAQLPKITAEIKDIYAGADEKRQAIQSSETKQLLDSWDLHQKETLFPLVQQLLSNDAVRSQLGLPKAQNMSDAEKTWWKKNITPYLDDMKSVMGGASTAAQWGWLFK